MSTATEVPRGALPHPDIADLDRQHQRYEKDCGRQEAEF